MHQHDYFFKTLAVVLVLITAALLTPALLGRQSGEGMMASIVNILGE